MSRISSVTQEGASAPVKELYAQIQKKMGKVPNIFLHMGNSPQVLTAFIKLNELTEQLSLPRNLQELIALGVSEANHCNYCVSAHSAIAKHMGIQEQDVLQARKSEHPDAKTTAILRFARSIVEKHGQVSDNEVAHLKAQGVSDRELAEIVLVVVSTIFTNYFNNAFKTEIDFPLAPKLA